MSDKTVKWEGVITAESSIVHGAQALGTITYLRRERFLMPDGSLEEIPVVSGNALRGVLRDVAADLWWERVGEPKLTLPVMHALWSGGALAKSSGAQLTGSRLAELRRLCPVVGIFGAAGGGRIIDGCLQVGKMIPLCQETLPFVPEVFQDGPAPSLWDLSQIEYYSKIPDEKPEVTGAKTEENAGGSLEEEKNSPARFGVETFVAGTKFYSWLALTWATSQEIDFFAEVLERFSANATVGGMGRAGHGKISFEWKTKPEVDVQSPWSLPLDGFTEDAPDRGKLLEVLSWLD